MNINLSELKNCIQIKKDHKLNTFLDIFLINPEKFKRFDALELSFFIYPYSRQLDADSFNFLPYEEYVKDVTAGKRSTYEVISPFADKLFGALVGLCITILFGIFIPAQIFSIEATVSILGAYTIGKELWKDLENLLVDMSKNWSIQWEDARYFYQKQDFGTIQRFWRLARIRRNGSRTVLPDELDFITQSNSKTIEILFKQQTLQSVSESQFLLASIDFASESLDSLNKEGYMFGLKMNLIKNKSFWQSNTEFYQALDKDSLGTLDKKGVWHAGKVLIRKSLNLGHIRYYLKPNLDNALEMIFRDI